MYPIGAGMAGRAERHRQEVAGPLRHALPFADVVDLYRFVTAAGAGKFGNAAHVCFVGVSHAITWLEMICTPTATMHAPGFVPAT